MSQKRHSPVPFLATELLAAFRRVKLAAASGTAVEYADQSDSSNYIGITVEDVAINMSVGVVLKGMQETHKATASEAFAVGATLYAADGGKVSDTSSGNVIGTALEAATADGDIVEVLLDNGSAAHTFPRSSIVQDDAEPYPIPVSLLRVWDAPSTVLPATPANDDLGVVCNTFLTAGPSVESEDLKAAGATDKFASFQFALPPEYVAGQTIALRVNAGMKTTVSDTTATIDAQAANLTDDETADIVATAAQSINSLVAADFDFTLTPTDAEPGDLLDVLLTMAINDGATGTAVIGKIYSVTLLLDIKG